MGFLQHNFGGGSDAIFVGDFCNIILGRFGGYFSGDFDNINLGKDLTQSSWVSFATCF